MHKCFLGIKKSFESKSVFSWACREGTDFSCIGSSGVFYTSFKLYRFLSFSVNVQRLYQLLQYSPVFSSGSTAQICTSAVNAPPPPHAFCAERCPTDLARSRSRSKACAQRHTSFPARFEMLWRTPNPQRGFGAFHLAMH